MLYIAINWFSDNVQTGMFEAKPELIKSEWKFIKQVTY